MAQKSLGNNWLCFLTQAYTNSGLSNLLTAVIEFWGYDAEGKCFYPLFPALQCQKD